MAGKSYRLEGIIIQRTNFGEADRILTIFSKQKGKVTCLAKGIRKISSRRAPSLELFNQVSLYIHKGKNIDFISEAELLQNFANLRKKLSLVALGYYLAELVDRLTAENQENLPVYHLLLHTFEKIDKEGKFGEEEIVKFQKYLLTNLGFGLPQKIDRSNLDWHIENIIDRKLSSKKFLKREIYYTGCKANTPSLRARG